MARQYRCALLLVAALFLNVPAVQTYTEQVLFTPGDYGSNCFRIPALATTKSGCIISVCDARYTGCGDLPGTIDVVQRRSIDNGTTWDSMKIIGHYASVGAGDPALVHDRTNGTVWCLFASNSGLFASTPTNRIEVNVISSTDEGVTWSSPRIISGSVYKTGWYGAWVASGAALQTRAGRLCAAVGVRENSGTTITNFMIYSDDHGTTWHSASGRAYTSGDEAKLLDLNNGTMMINIRNSDYRRINTSLDSGNTWGTAYLDNALPDPACNGDLIRYTSTLDGYNKNRVLFSNCANINLRKNLTVRISYDEASTWTYSRVIDTGVTAYSAMTILADGSIGLYYEKGSSMRMVFAKFNLEWLTTGRDTFRLATSVVPREPSRGSNGGLVVQSMVNAGTLNITMKGIRAGGYSIALCDIRGRTLLSRTGLGNSSITETMDVSGFPKGLYLLACRNGDEKSLNKIVLR
jgi:Neuraminidase (sialidase)